MLKRFVVGLFFLFGSSILFGQTEQWAEEGFTKELVTGAINSAVGIKFAPDGTGFIWTQDGKVYIRTVAGEVSENPILNLRQEVHSTGDHGMLGLAIDPDFENNGYFYVMFVVDKHHWLYFGTPEYDPEASISGQATFGRLCRFSADLSNDFEVDPLSRFTLFGETPDSGVPILHSSHGIGSLVFGEDGTLLVSTGDGSTWEGHYIGGGPPYFNEDVEGALEHDIITANMDVGAYRSQLLEALNGKVLRIDPATGFGIPSNPFFETENPNSARSKVWAMGLRNPFKINLRPGFGASDPSDGNPGHIIVGNVGLSIYEEIDICTGPGQNFGWPQYEAHRTMTDFASGDVFNQFAPNPLSGNGCEQDYFKFRDLLKKPTLGGQYFGNPCNTTVPISSSEVFELKMPSFAYNNDANWVSSDANGWLYEFDSNGEIQGIPYTDPSSGEVVELSGFASVAGDVYEGSSFPPQFQGLYFHADFKGWIRGFEFDQDGNFILTQPFLNQPNKPIVHLEYNPIEDALYIIEYPTGIHKIYYGENPNPVAKILASTLYGPGPLSVDFDGSESSSPSDQNLTYEWYVEDELLDQVNFTYEFESLDSTPIEKVVSLVVTDEENRTDSTAVVISLNNTPPTVNIATIAEGELYPIDLPSTIPLSAWYQDSEFSESEMEFNWQSILRHNTHFHIEFEQDEPYTQGEVPSAGCGNEYYAYEFGIEVVDGAGLRASENILLEPYCGGEAVPFFTDFKIETLPNSNYLEWQITSAERTDKIVIYRGPSQNEIFPIDTLYNVSTTNPSYVDYSPQLGDNYYVAKIFTPENVIRFSFTNKITNANFSEGAIVFPNPTSGEARFFLQGEPGVFELLITNSIGQVMRRETGSSITGSITGVIDLSELAVGVYTLSLAGDTRSEFYKIVKR